MGPRDLDRRYGHPTHDKVAMVRFLTIGCLAVCLPLLVHAATPSNFKELVDEIVTIMNWTVSLIITAGIVVYFWGVVKHIYDHGYSEESWEMRRFLLMGLGVIFVMVSIWGILALLQNSLDLGSSQYIP